MALEAPNLYPVAKYILYDSPKQPDFSTIACLFRDIETLGHSIMRFGVS